MRPEGTVAIFGGRATAAVVVVLVRLSVGNQRGGVFVALEGREVTNKILLNHQSERSGSVKKSTDESMIEPS